jgi:hypothetical protein
VIILSEEFYLKLEQEFKRGTFPSPQSFHFSEGKIPVLISAPHSTDHFRKGKVKKGEYETGILSLSMQQKIDSYAYYRTKISKDDPNFDKEHPYKIELAKIISENQIPLLIDIHIARASRLFSIEIGTNFGNNLTVQKELGSISKNFFENSETGKIVMDALFTASNPDTVSSYISRVCGIDCLQIEINRQLIGTPAEFFKFQEIFKEYILFLVNTFYKIQTNP